MSGAPPGASAGGDGFPSGIPGGAEVGRWLTTQRSRLSQAGQLPAISTGLAVQDNALNLVRISNSFAAGLGNPTIDHSPGWINQYRQCLNAAMANTASGAAGAEVYQHIKATYPVNRFGQVSDEVRRTPCIFSNEQVQGLLSRVGQSPDANYIKDAAIGMIDYASQVMAQFVANNRQQARMQTIPTPSTPGSIRLRHGFVHPPILAQIIGLYHLINATGNLIPRLSSIQSTNMIVLDFMVNHTIVPLNGVKYPANLQLTQVYKSAHGAVQAYLDVVMCLNECFSSGTILPPNTAKQNGCPILAIHPAGWIQGMIINFPKSIPDQAKVVQSVTRLLPARIKSAHSSLNRYYSLVNSILMGQAQLTRVRPTMTTASDSLGISDPLADPFADPFADPLSNPMSSVLGLNDPFASSLANPLSPPMTTGDDSDDDTEYVTVFSVDQRPSLGSPNPTLGPGFDAEWAGWGLSGSTGLGMPDPIGMYSSPDGAANLGSGILPDSGAGLGLEFGSGMPGMGAFGAEASLLPFGGLGGMPGSANGSGIGSSSPLDWKPPGSRRPPGISSLESFDILDWQP